MRIRYIALLVAGALSIVIRSSQPVMAVTVDWRTKGVVTAVQDQGDFACNPSWAFAVASTLASHILLAGQAPLIDLSEQQLIDCNAAGAPTACECPQLGETFSFIQNHGLCTEAAYPYVGQSGACTPCTASVATTMAQWKSITGGSEATLISALNAGPVMARLEVGSNGAPLPAYASYSGGVVGPIESDASVVQWVVVVGYTDTEFIVKNSLGTSWGESGYIRLARGSNVFGIVNFVYGVTLGDTDVGPVPGAPCSPWRSAPALSPVALILLVALLGLVSIASFYRPRRSARPSVG